MNVNLWFARNKENEIITITDAHSNKEHYSCPICNSEVIPKALESRTVTPHFAHIDRSKCSSEAMIHWWYKHKFIDRGDTFTIKTDEEHTYVCKDFKVEHSFELSSGVYEPDLIVYTECGNEIVFEMANTNKKKVQDYIDLWIALDRIIVEIDIRNLISEDKVFNALYYNGKCFNFNKRDGGYYNTIGRLKEKMKQDNNYDIELVKKLDWFWKEVAHYKSGVSDIESYSRVIDELQSSSNKVYDVINRILKKSVCSPLYSDYKNFKTLDNSVIYPFKDSLDNIEKIISTINQILNPMDDRFKIKLKPIVEYKYETYYHGSRKYKYKSRIVDKNYKFEINIYNKKRKALSIPVTNRFNLIKDKYQFIFDNSIHVLSNFKNLCSECKSPYLLEDGEIRFLLNKNFNLPKRCKSCRQKRKKERLN